MVKQVVVEVNKDPRRPRRPPELKASDTDRSVPGVGAMVGDRVGYATIERQPRVSTMASVLTTRRDNMGEKRTYSVLFVYNTENRYTNPTNKPSLGWIIAETPAAVRTGRYMVLLVNKWGVNMVMMGQ